MEAMNTSNYVAVMVCLLCGIMNIVRLVPFLSQVDMEDEVRLFSILFGWVYNGLFQKKNVHRSGRYIVQGYRKNPEKLSCPGVNFCVQRVNLMLVQE